MKTIFSIFIYIALCITFISCTKEEWEHFTLIELDIQGIELYRDHFELSAVIPCGGVEFVLTGTGKYADKDWIEFIYVDNISQTSGRNTDESASEYTETLGEWGSAKHYMKTVPVCSKFIITPNKTGKTREIKIKISRMYETATIKISQLPEIES